MGQSPVKKAGHFDLVKEWQLINAKQRGED
jgi:hypothetical protein